MDSGVRAGVRASVAVTQRPEASSAGRHFNEVINQGNLDLLAELFSPDLATFTQVAVTRLRAAFPDLHVTISDQIAEQAKVATVWTLTGTHHGPWESPMGEVAPTGRSVCYTGTNTLRTADGKIVEVLGSNHDHLGLLQQLGARPALAPRAGA